MRKFRLLAAIQAMGINAILGGIIFFSNPLKEDFSLSYFFAQLLMPFFIGLVYGYLERVQGKGGNEISDVIVWIQAALASGYFGTVGMGLSGPVILTSFFLGYATKLHPVSLAKGGAIQCQGGLKIDPVSGTKIDPPPG